MKPREIPGLVSVTLLLTFLLSVVNGFSQTSSTNNWTKPTSGNWDDPSAWSLGVLPNSSQSIQITNSGWKAVAINPSTPINFPDSMTVDSLTIRGAWDTMNALLLNYAGTTTPLHVLKDFNVQTNGRLVMLYSGLRVDNVLNLQGELEQEGGQLAFPTSTMQIEGGSLNLTNGGVTGSSIYLGGARDGYMNHDGGVVSLTNWLALGEKAGVGPNTSNGTYVLRNGWLMVGVHEAVGFHGFGTLIQEGGTNTAPRIAVGNGHYMKNGGGLFAGEIDILASYGSLPSAGMTHAGGTATISNAVRAVGGDRMFSSPVRFNMLGGSLSTPRIELLYGGILTQSNGTVRAGQLYIENATFKGTSYYTLSGGNVFDVWASISSECSMSQSGGTHIVTNQLWLGDTAVYRFSGGTFGSRNIVLSGNLPYGPKFFILQAPPFTITNENISLGSGTIEIEDSAQQFGRLTIERESVLNFAGNSAILRFADSHTNNWETGSSWDWLYARLTVSNWNGSLNGGGADQLRFGNNQSALTPAQVNRIYFVNPAGMPPGTYPGKILATGEVVPGSRPALTMTRSPNRMVISWSGNYHLFSSTNVLGPYAAIEDATSPYAVFFSDRQRFFYLRSP